MRRFDFPLPPEQAAQRAWTDEEKDAIIARLREVWKAQPSLRLAQLIANVFREYDEVRDAGTPIEWRLDGWTRFYTIEDRPFIERLERHYRDHPVPPEYGR